MARVLKYPFAMICSDAGSSTVELRLVARSDGELEIVGDYDLEADLAWGELAETGLSGCAEALLVWAANPIDFLIRLGQGSDWTKLRVAAGFAAHAWEHSSIAAPQSVLAALDYAAAMVPVSENLAGMIMRSDMLSVRGWDEVEAHGDLAATRALAAAGSLVDAWRDQARGQVRALYDSLLHVAWQAQRAAFNEVGDNEEIFASPQAEAERTWQLRYMLECLIAERDGTPWPSP
jgi:hypothetical protein